MAPKVKQKRSHKDNCYVVCAGCFRKSASSRKITKELEITIEDHIYSEFSLDNEAFSKVLCSTCRIALTDLSKHGQNSKRILPPKPDYKNFKFPVPVTRSSETVDCICTIYLIGREKVPDIPKCKGDPIGRPITRLISPPSQTIPMCSKCFTVKKNIFAHDCKTTTLEKISLSW